MPPDMLPAFAGLHILTEENRKRLSSFGRKQKGNGRAFVRAMEHITRSIVLPDDTINRRKAKGHGICADRRTLGVAHCFNRTLENNRQCLENGKQKKGFRHLPEPLPCVLQLMLKLFASNVFCCKRISSGSAGVSCEQCSCQLIPGAAGSVQCLREGITRSIRIIFFRPGCTGAPTAASPILQHQITPETDFGACGESLRLDIYTDFSNRRTGDRNNRIRKNWSCICGYSRSFRIILIRKIGIFRCHT